MPLICVSCVLCDSVFYCMTVHTHPPTHPDPYSPTSTQPLIQKAVPQRQAPVSTLTHAPLPRRFSCDAPLPLFLQPLPPPTSLPPPLQKTLILFGGGINQTHLTDATRPESDAGYSFGVRQTFAR